MKTLNKNQKTALEKIEKIISDRNGETAIIKTYYTDRPAEVDPRTFKALIRKGLIVKNNGFTRITDAGRAALGIAQ